MSSRMRQLLREYGLVRAGRRAQDRRRGVGIVGFGPERLENRALLTGPTVPVGYTLGIVAQGPSAPFAGSHLDGLVVDPGSGNLYVASDAQPDQSSPISSQFQTYASFDLWRVTPSGAVSQVGTYAVSHTETTTLAWGPDGQIYTIDTNGNVFAIDPASGAISTYASTNLSLGRLGLQFDGAGNLILMPSTSPDSFYRVTPGAGAVYLGSYTQTNGEFGSSFGIQPDGNYVLYPDGGGGPGGRNVVTQVITAGHADGTNYAIRHLTGTAIDATAPAANGLPRGGLLIPVGHSIGAVDPVTGDVYASSANNGSGATRITFTPGEVGPGATTSVFVDHIGNGVLPRAGYPGGQCWGVTALAFGPRTDGAPGNSLFFLDDDTDTIYEVRSQATAAASASSVALASSSSGNGSTFGDSVTFTATVSGAGGTPTGSVQFLDGQAVLGTATLGANGTASLVVSTLNAGVHPISARYAGDANFAPSSAALRQSVARAAPTFSNLSGGSITYGATDLILTGLIEAGARPAPGFVQVNVGPVGQTASIDQTTGAFSLDVPATLLQASTSPYAITYSYSGTTNFAPASDSTQTLAVARAHLTVSASNASRTYGAADPAYSATISGFVNGEGASVVSGSPAFSTAATVASGVGSYALNVGVGTLAAANYDFTTFVPGTLTITPAHLTVTLNNTSKVYGDVNPPFSATLSGFVNGEDASVISGSPSFSTTATASSGVGSYPVTVGQGSLAAANYDFNALVPGTLTITPASLMVSADNVTMVYGSALPLLTVSYTGLVNGDTPSSLASLGVATTSATSASHVGSYPISVSGAASANYTITFVPGTLTVTPAPLTIWADDQTMTYGGTLPTLTARYVGLVNNDSAASLASPVILSTVATPSSPVGSYPINAAGATSTDYTIRFAPGTLSVTPAHLTVTANDASRTYGAADPAYSATISGFVNGEGASVVSGSPAFSTAATVASGVGSYALNVGVGTLAAANYDFTTFVPGTLRITPAHLTVTVNDAFKVYGDANPAFSVTVSGFVNGDAVSVVSGSASFSTSATAASGVGMYPVSAGPGTLAAANYDFATFVAGTLTVEKATPTIAGTSDVTIAAGTAQVTLSGTIGAGALVPTGSVTVTLAGQSYAAPINPDGTFSASVATGSLVAGTYTATYAYAGDANFNGASDTSVVTTRSIYKFVVKTDLDDPKRGGSTLKIRLAILDLNGNNATTPDLVVTAVGIAPASNPGAIIAPTTPCGFTYNPDGDGDTDFRTTQHGIDVLKLKLVDASGHRLAAGTYLFFFRIGNDPTLQSFQFRVK